MDRLDRMLNPKWDGLKSFGKLDFLEDLERRLDPFRDMRGILEPVEVVEPEFTPVSRVVKPAPFAIISRLRRRHVRTVSRMPKRRRGPVRS